MQNITVLVSGGGTNLQALLDAQAAGLLNSGRITRVIASRPGVYALERAAKAGIETAVVQKSAYTGEDAYVAAFLEALRAAKTDLMVLAGFMTILPKEVLACYEGRVVNVHPALIPAFSGKGFYGLRVHQAALEAGVKITGATVHLVNEVVDGGKILAQKAIDVCDGDTPESLQKRVMEQCEWILLPQTVEALCTQLEQEKGAKDA